MNPNASILLGEITINQDFTYRCIFSPEHPNYLATSTPRSMD